MAPRNVVKISDAKAKTAGRAAAEDGRVTISPPNMVVAKIKIVGTAPYVMNKMSSKNREAMMAAQQLGSQAKKGRKREPKDFNAVYEGAMHVSEQGWYGIPASSFRNAMISACKIVGFHMTRAKLAVFIKSDGIDDDDGTPLVKIFGKPRRRDLAVKLANGSSDIIARPFFDDWSAEIRVRWDADMFSATDVVNLLSRAGMQVGIGAGRPDSKASAGMGWGTFSVEA